MVNGTTPSGTVLNALVATLPTAGTFQDFSVSYTTGGSVSGDLTIVFSSPGVQPLLDNVRLSGVTIPEPGSFVLLGLGAVGLATFARRRRAGQRAA